MSDMTPIYDEMVEKYAESNKTGKPGKHRKSEIDDIWGDFYK